METRHREILRKCRTILVRDLQCIPEVCDLLFEFHILTLGMKDEISAISTREGQVRKLLDIVVRRGSRSFDYLHQVLVDTHQQFLADVLKPELAAVEHPAYDSISNDKKDQFKRSKTVDHSILEHKRQTSTEENERNHSYQQTSANLENCGILMVPSGSISPQIEGHSEQYNMFSNLSNISLSATYPGTRNKVQANFDLQSNSTVVTQPEADQMVTQPEEENQLPAVWPSVEDDARPAHVEVRQFQLSEPRSLSLLQQTDNYPMTENPRGILLVINNATFNPETGLSTRNTADVDGTSVDLLFNQLHFKRRTHRNLSGQKILEVLDKERQSDHSQYQCFVLVIMSHGFGKTIYGSDGGEISLDTILNKFNISNCPSLADKPKLFFFQACQSLKTCKGKLEDDSLSSDFDSLGKDLEELVGSISLNQVQPNDGTFNKTDMFIARATTTESLRWRNEERGSKFIQALVYVFKKLAYTEDLLSMMTKVNGLVSSGDSPYCSSTQMVEFTSSLQKKLYFFPGFPPQDKIEHRTGNS